MSNYGYNRWAGNYATTQENVPEHREAPLPPGLQPPPPQPFRSQGEIHNAPVNAPIDVGDFGNQARLRRLGQRMGGGAAYQADFGQANQARDAQANALGLQQQAAMGAAPSRAELLGRQMGSDSLNAQLAGAASARGGPMAQAAAMRGAAGGAAIAQQQGTNAMAAMRAGEMADARNAYQAGASGMRSADLTGAGMQSENVRFQRGLNQAGQLGAEGMALDQDKAQAQIGLGQQQDASANYRAQIAEDAANYRNRSQVNQHSTDRSTNALTSGIGGAMMSAAGLAFLSDPAAKTDVRLLDQPMGVHEPWMPHEDDPNSFDSQFDRFSRPPPMSASAGRDQPMGGPAAPMSLDEAYGGSPRAKPSPMSLDEAYAGYSQPMPGPSAHPDESGGDASDRQTAAGASMISQGGSLIAKPIASMPYTEISDSRAKRLLQPMKISDDRAKLAAAWDEGHDAAASDAERIAQMPPDRLRDLSGDNRLAAALGAARAGAWDEGNGSPRRLADARPDDNDDHPSPGLAMPRQGPHADVLEGRGYARRAEEQRGATHPDVREGRENARLAAEHRGPRVSLDSPMPGPSDAMAQYAREAPPAEMLDALGGGKSFRYKPGIPGEDPSKVHFGTTTQDLKSTPMGSSVVVPGPGGFDAIDVREAVGPTFASLGNLNQRLRLLESKMGKDGR